MRTIEFTLRGIRPMMLSAEKPFEGAEEKPAKQKSQPSAMEQAEAHLHKAKIDGKEVCVMPGINVQKCIQAAYPYMPSPGKRKGWTSLVRTISVDELHLAIEPQRWTLDARRSGTGFGKNGTMLYRPRFDEWQISGHLTYDDVHLSEEQVRELVDNAGRYIGLGAWRVQNRGPYGKFVVALWKDMEVAA